MDERCSTHEQTLAPPPGWSEDWFFGQPAWHHPQHGMVIATSRDAHDCLVVPRNGRPHEHVPSLDQACADCASANHTEPDGPPSIDAWWQEAPGFFMTGRHPLFASCLWLLGVMVVLAAVHWGVHLHSQSLVIGRPF